MKYTILFVVILAVGAAGYFLRPNPQQIQTTVIDEPLQTTTTNEPPKSTSSTMTSRAVIKVASSILAVAPGNYPEIILPSDCKIIEEGSSSLVDCGSKNTNVREALGSTLTEQGWQFCKEVSAVSAWWKQGVLAVAGSIGGSATPFQISLQITASGDRCDAFRMGYE